MKGLKKSRDGILFLVVLACMLPLPVRAADNMGFKGTLLDRPCRLDPASDGQNIELYERPVVDFWYLPGRGPKKEFTIKLVNCHATTINKIVRVTFEGVAEPKLPGYLAVRGKNAGRLAVGIVDTDGSSLLKLGVAHNKGGGDKVTANTVTLTFGAYPQATPEAIASKSVVPGEYDATTNFKLSYN